MLEAQTELLGPRSQITRLTRHGQTLSMATVVAAWQSDATFRSEFSRLLVEVPYSAYAWELPPQIETTHDRPFEMAIIESPGLDGMVSGRAAFSEHFADGRAVVVFPNLGNDARLIAPTAAPRVDEAVYLHLARFVCNGPAEQIDALWQRVGAEIRASLSGAPLWVSTAGLGVGWLHVRLDTHPKYYRHHAYTRWPPS